MAQQQKSWASPAPARKVMRRNRSHDTRHEQSNFKPTQGIGTALLLVTLALMTAGFGLAGLLLRPTDTGPPALVPNEAIDTWIIGFTEPPPANYLLSEYETACVPNRNSCPDSLTLTVDGGSHALPSFTIVTYELAGTCPHPLRNNGAACYLDVKSDHRDVFTVRFEYPPETFYKQNGAYASGFLPGFTPLVNNVSGKAVPVARVQQSLVIGNGYVRPVQISMLSGPPPSTMALNDLYWHSRSNDGSPVLSLVITDPYIVSTDARNGFLSGILLGVAGSAAVALVTEVIRPDRRRKAGTEMAVKSSRSTNCVNVTQKSDGRNGGPCNTTADLRAAMNKEQGLFSPIALSVAGATFVALVVGVVRRKWRRANM